jgi:hypothetical protein
MTSNEAAYRCAHFVGDRHVGMLAAENDNRKSRRRAVGTGAQSPLYANRVEHTPAQPSKEGVG